MYIRHYQYLRKYVMPAKTDFDEYCKNFPVTQHKTILRFDTFSIGGMQVHEGIRELLELPVQ